MPQQDGTASEDTRPATEPLVLRPGRLPGLLWLPVGICVFALAVAVYRGGLKTAGMLLMFTGVLTVISAVTRLTGRTVFDRDGIRNRVLLSQRHLPWSEVRSVVVEGHLLARTARVVRHTGADVVLAAPRDTYRASRSTLDEQVAAVREQAPPAVEIALRPRPDRASRAVTAGVVLVLMGLATGLFLFFDRPWNHPWWPGRHEATALPDACFSGSPIAERLTGGTPFKGGSDSDTRSSCTWQGEDGRVSVEYTLHEQQVLGDSGTARAEEDFDRAAQPAAPLQRSSPIAGLGDEAARITGSPAGTGVDIVVRRANTVITVRYFGREDGSAERHADEVERLARQAVQRISLV